MLVQGPKGNESIDLPEIALHSPLQVCPVCHFREAVPQLDLQDTPSVQLMACGHCHARYAGRMPTQAALDAYYARYYALPKYRDLQESVHFSRPERLADHLMASLRPPSRDCIRIIDFGGGDGTVSVLLAERLLRAGTRKVKIELIDYGSAIHCPQKEDIEIARLNSVDQMQGCYDIVIASASLEHVPALRQTLTALFAGMSSGAKFYARTPFMVPLIRCARILGLRIGFGWPAHLYDLGASFWRRLPENLGLTDEYHVIISRPAIVESTFSSAPLRTVAAHLLKAPWHLLGDRYGLVGGWEAVIERQS